jgi:predicted small lipoprotein YifL
MRFFLLFIAAASLAGCGYRGPLYLPQPKAEAPKPPAPDKPASAPGAAESDTSARPQ